MQHYIPIIYWSGFVIAFLCTFYYYEAKDDGLLPCMFLIGFIWPIALVITTCMLVYSAKDSLEGWKNANRQRNDSGGDKAG